jgi:hypothetical protein
MGNQYETIPRGVPVTSSYHDKHGAEAEGQGSWQERRQKDNAARSERTRVRREDQ